MKCPNCDFTDKDEAFGLPATCPSCGAVYSKALRVKEMRQQLDRQKAGHEEIEDPKPTIKDRIAGAADSVSEGRKRRANDSLEKHLEKEKRMVVVTDIDMPFWSMVSFMIKWAFAAIPAMFIIFMVYTFILALIGQL